MLKSNQNSFNIFGVLLNDMYISPNIIFFKAKSKNKIAISFPITCNYKIEILTFCTTR